MFACPATDDFFRARIDQMIDLRHPLAVLASRMPWQEIEAAVAHRFLRKAHDGVAMPDLDLFGEKVQRQVSRSNAGRPRVPLRIMISLLYLKHAFNESDEGVVARWADTPRWQFFSGQMAQERRQLKRRQAIEPIIGHLKADHRMDRCHLKGEYGDRLHAVLCAAGYNIKWLLRMIAKKGVPILRAIFLRLAKGTIPRRFWLALAARRPGGRLNDSLGVRKLWLLAA